MKHAQARTLYDYWNRLRSGEPAPRREALDPAAIRSQLGDTFLLEAVNPNTYLFRLAGTRVCNLYCRELRSENFLSMWPAEDSEAFATLLAAVTEDAAVASVGIECVSAHGHRLPVEAVILPLRHRGPNFDRAFGAFFPVERPYWLGTQPVVRQKITTLRLIWPDEHPSLPLHIVSAEGTAASLAARRREPARYGQFTVYEGGRQ